MVEGYRIVPLEAFVLRSVRHEGVVAYIDLFEDEKYFYLVSFASVISQRARIDADLWNRSWSITVLPGLAHPRRKRRQTPLPPPTLLLARSL